MLYVIHPIGYIPFLPLTNSSLKKGIEDALRKSFEAFANLWNQWWIALDKKALYKKDTYKNMVADAQMPAVFASTMIDNLGLKDLNFLEGFSEKMQKGMRVLT